MATLEYRMQQRRDTYANWAAEDPVLLAGEIGYVTDRDYYIIGDGTAAFTSVSKAYLATPLNGLYNLEDTHDLSASALQIDFTDLTGSVNIFDQPDGYTYSIAWSGGDGTYQLTFDGGTYTGKTIGGVDADSLAADMTGDGQGRLTVRKDGSNLRVLHFSDNDGGNFTGDCDTFDKTAQGRMTQEASGTGNTTSTPKPFCIPFAEPPRGSGTVQEASQGRSFTFDQPTTTAQYYPETESGALEYEALFVGRWTTLYPQEG